MTLSPVTDKISRMDIVKPGSRLKVAIEIRDKINEALTLVEPAISEDPNHLDWYMAVKEALELADSELSFPLND